MSPVLYHDQQKIHSNLEGIHRRTSDNLFTIEFEITIFIFHVHLLLVAPRNGVTTSSNLTRFDAVEFTSDTSPRTEKPLLFL